jgi:hypothetical protein
MKPMPAPTCTLPGLAALVELGAPVAVARKAASEPVTAAVVGAAVAEAEPGEPWVPEPPVMLKYPE